MNQITMIEPTFAEAVVAIEAAADLPLQKRRQWTCALRQTAKALDKPLEIIPARWTAVCLPIGTLHHTRLGLTKKTLDNYKSNVRAALRWFGKEHQVPVRGAPLTPAWMILREKLMERRPRALLSGLMRYCSARGTDPGAVNDATVDDYMAYRGATTRLATNSMAWRALARAWNGNIGVVRGWPTQRLLEPPLKEAEGPLWQQFPVALQLDVESYLGLLTKIRRGLNGKRIRPCKASTLRGRRAELVAFVRMAVRVGVKIETLTSFAALLDPDVVEKVLEAYCKKDGGEPRIYTIGLSAMLVSAARLTGCLDADQLRRLDDMRASLDDDRREGLTPKNLTLIRQVLVDEVWADLVNLPARLMQDARSLRDYAPVKAAITAQLAVAIAILTVAPVRLGNLIRIRLDENLIKPAGPSFPFTLVFPDYDVKNRMALEFPLDPVLTSLIDEYCYDFRPTLLRGSNDTWLFPGEAGGFKTSNMFSTQITERIEKTIGLRITAHQFRHAAAAIILKHRPGEYEVVRRVLGHRSMQTTVNFYCSLETTQASVIYGDIVREQMVRRSRAIA